MTDEEINSLAAQTLPNMHKLWDAVGYDNIVCGSCKFMTQFKNCCACIHPANELDAKALYVYYNFRCQHWRKGKRFSESEMREMGYEVSERRRVDIPGQPGSAIVVYKDTNQARETAKRKLREHGIHSNP